MMAASTEDVRTHHDDTMTRWHEDATKTTLEIIVSIVPFVIERQRRSASNWVSEMMGKP